MKYARGEMLTIKLVPGAITLTNRDEGIHYVKKLSKRQLLWFALQALQAAMQTEEEVQNGLHDNGTR